MSSRKLMMEETLLLLQFSGVNMDIAHRRVNIISNSPRMKGMKYIVKYIRSFY
jgi:hypothetical protein